MRKIALVAGLALAAHSALAQNAPSPTLKNPLVSGTLQFSGSGYPVLPSWTSAPSTAAGVVGYNTGTGRYEFGTGASVVNHVRLSGDTMTGQLTVGATTQNQVAIIPKSSGTSPQVAAQGTDTNLDLVLIAKGTGVVRTSTTGIFRTPWLSLSSGTYTWSGNSGGEGHSLLYGSAGFSGTSGSSESALSYIAYNSDTLDCSTASGALCSGFEVNHNFGGAAMKASRNVISGTGTLTATTGNTGGGSYVAGNFTMKAGVNDGGTSGAGNERSALFGINTTAGLTGSGATYWAGIVGEEIDMYAATGSSLKDKVGMQIVQTSQDAVSGWQDNIALSINNQYAPNTGSPWAIGIAFGKTQGNFPIASTGTLIYGTGPSAGSWTVANGLDFHLGTATSYWFRFGSVASLTGAGALNAASYSAGGTAGVTCSGTPTASYAVTNGIVTHC